VTRSDAVLLFSSLACALIATVSLSIALKERRRGSAFWLLPGVFGVLLVIVCLVRVMLWAA
jgi:inner membrane protein involved in colicin E2 resistance